MKQERVKTDASNVALARKQIQRVENVFRRRRAFKLMHYAVDELRRRYGELKLIYLCRLK